VTEGNKRMKQISDKLKWLRKTKQMVGIMGASGSGKTSLLNVLAQRLSLTEGAVLDGYVKCNNRTVDYDDFGKFEHLYSR